MAKKDETEMSAPKYGVNDLAELLDIVPASVRVALRNHGIAKAGRAYGWNTKAELDAVAKQLKTEKPAKEEKPAKATAKKATTKAAVKKAVPKAKKKEAETQAAA